MRIKQANRLKVLPPYLFAEIDKKKAELAEKGMDIISLGVGDPDLPTPGHIIERLKDASENPANHQYPSYEGMLDLRRSVADWYSSRFAVDLEPGTEVVSLIGSKEGIAHIPLAFVDPGDVVLCPDPAYPVYKIGAVFAGGEPVQMPLLEENGFLPDLGAIPADVLKRAKMIFINYPNNPTAACADSAFFSEVVDLALKNNIIVCHDAAYTELYYNDYCPSSFLEVPGAKEVGIEFHSLSKTYNMTGWRIGFACGNPEVVSGLGSIKTNIDSGIFQAVQEAGIEAITADQEPVAKLRKIYEARRDLACDALKNMGFDFEIPKATFYIWVTVPDGIRSADFVSRVLTETGVVLTPGNGFGDFGEGYFRISLTVDEERLSEALGRMSSISW